MIEYQNELVNQYVQEIEKVKSESKQLCKTLNPFATAAAPNATPYAPTVRETLRESRNVGEETLDTPAFCRINPTAQSAF